MVLAIFFIQSGAILFPGRGRLIFFFFGVVASGFLVGLGAGVFAFAGHTVALPGFSYLILLRHETKLQFLRINIQMDQNSKEPFKWIDTKEYEMHTAWYLHRAYGTPIPDHLKEKMHGTLPRNDNPKEHPQVDENPALEGSGKGKNNTV